ncbi:MAG: NAD(P)H-dependent oxidoreductase subunit E [Desulfobacteraceae bacterium]|jgi:NADH:ubiquinone oxidoreductase subunit E|nr:MAG: NAD(P)H-dependent oxidoreductase subunit E [Desulfobacteraceae bacterium]
MRETTALCTKPVIELDFMELDRIIDDEYSRDKENLIMILQAIQNTYNYLPKPTLAYLSEKTGVPLSQIYGVATFYKTFSLEPRGKNIIYVCLGTACHVRGGGKIMDRLKEILRIDTGETTEDMRFTLEGVRCIGCCSLGPVIKINEDIHSRISGDMVENILSKYA